METEERSTWVHTAFFQPLVQLRHERIADGEHAAERCRDADAKRVLLGPFHDPGFFDDRHAAPSPVIPVVGSRESSVSD
jgi:hypothetical protein